MKLFTYLFIIASLTAGLLEASEATGWLPSPDPNGTFTTCRWVCPDNAQRYVEWISENGTFKVTIHEGGFDRVVKDIDRMTFCPEILDYRFDIAGYMVRILRHRQLMGYGAVVHSGGDILM